ncbi:hypothetical protein MNBD_GAMMA17-620 [hydrothermal vent metagenome]|uniref:Uncharacterized protein n=1 Tax=hydrothermal vent metagenome TaxID=652676 RepID=A0A3B0ZF23_9ZZZZ
MMLTMVWVGLNDISGNDYAQQTKYDKKGQ